MLSEMAHISVSAREIEQNLRSLERKPQMNACLKMLTAVEPAGVLFPQCLLSLGVNAE